MQLGLEPGLLHSVRFYGWGNLQPGWADFFFPKRSILAKKGSTTQAHQLTTLACLPPADAIYIHCA